VVTYLAVPVPDTGQPSTNPTEGCLMMSQRTLTRDSSYPCWQGSAGEWNRCYRKK